MFIVIIIQTYAYLDEEGIHCCLVVNCFITTNDHITEVVKIVALQIQFQRPTNNQFFQLKSCQHHSHDFKYKTIKPH